MISEVLNLICSWTISLYSQCSQVVLPKTHLKVPEFCRSDFGYFWLFFKSAGTYCTTSGGPVRSPEKSGSLINGHVWLVIKTHQTNLMIRTKGQNMLRCSGQNANEKLGRTKSPVGIVSGWHFIQLAFCLTTLFNHMSWWPIPKKSRSSVISVIFQALKFFIWKDTSIITLEINRSSATSATILRLNLAKLVNTTFSFP